MGKRGALWVGLGACLLMVGKASWARSPSETNPQVFIRVTDEEGRVVPDAQLYVKGESVSLMIPADKENVQLPPGQYSAYSAYVQKSPEGDVERYVSYPATFLVDRDNPIWVALTLHNLDPHSSRTLKGVFKTSFLK